MIEPFIGAFAKLASGEIGKRQIVSALVCFVCALILLVVYERYTSNFRFSRLEKAAKLLSELNSIKSGVQSNEHLKSIHSIIVANLEEIVGIETPKIIKHSLFGKFLGGFWLWFLLGLFTLSRSKHGEREFKALYGLCFIGAIIAFICTFIPEISWPWFHWFVYPFGIVGLILLSFIVAGVTSAAKTKSKAEQKTEGGGTVR